VIVDPATLARRSGNCSTSTAADEGGHLLVASQSSLVVRLIEVPRMTAQELAQTMQFEVERHIPFAASEVVMDFQPMVAPEQLPPEAQNMDVLLAVAQEDMINAHLDTLFKAGLDPIALDVEPLSACRSLIDINAELGAYDETYALLNIGAATTDLSIIRNGLLNFTRPVPMAGDSITQAIADSLGYEFHEAERMKIEHAALQVESAPALPERGTDMPTSTAPAATAPAVDDDLTSLPLLDDEADRSVGPSSTGAESLSLGGRQRLPAAGLGLLHAAHAGRGTLQRQYDAILPVMADLVSEVRRSIDYYANKLSDSRVNRFCFRRLGDRSELRRFRQRGGRGGARRQSLRAEVDRKVPSEMVERQACHAHRGGPPSGGHAAVAGEPMISINLLPSYIRKRDAKAVIALDGAGRVGVAALLGALRLGARAVVADLQGEDAKVELAAGFDRGRVLHCRTRRSRSRPLRRQAEVRWYRKADADKEAGVMGAVLPDSQQAHPRRRVVNGFLPAAAASRLVRRATRRRRRAGILNMLRCEMAADHQYRSTPPRWAGWASWGERETRRCPPR
jgi:type IV pilus assembly protein PilM